MLLQFQKGDIVRHLGLLDLQRTMQRALRRSGLPIRYSKGFNPHMVMSFASALSSGIPGDAELLDVSLDGEATPEECMAAMNRVLPPSLSVSRVRMVDDSFPKLGASLRYAQYRISLSGAGTDKAVDAIGSFLAQDEIMALRKTKKSETMVNIRPMIQELSVCERPAKDEAVLTARVSFVELATLKPELLMDTLFAFCGAQPQRCEIRRTALLGLVDDQPVSLIDM